MALSANTVWEVRYGGSDTNGGGFVPGSGGTDYSQQNAANTSGVNISVTDMVTNGTSTISSATANFTSAIVGNLIYIAGGTNSVSGQWHQVLTYVSSTQVTIDITITAGTGVTMNIGGALASLGMAGICSVTGNTIFAQYNTTPFPLAGGAPNTSGNGISMSAKTVCGYNTTRVIGNTDANRPTFQNTVTTVFAPITCSGVDAQVYNLIIDKNALAGSGIVTGTSTSSLVSNCVVKNASASYPAFSGFGVFIGCAAISNGQWGFSTAVSLHGCYSSSGFSLGTGAIATHCVSSGGGGFSCSTAATMVNCTSYGSTTHGFSLTAASYQVVLIGCLAESNGGWGFSGYSATGVLALFNCAGYGNTSGTFQNATQTGFIPITVGSALVAPGSGNFALNNLPGQGALLRAANSALNTVNATTGYLDIGAAQHQDTPAISVECHSVLVRDGIGIAAY